MRSIERMLVVFIAGTILLATPLAAQEENNASREIVYFVRQSGFMG